MLANDVRRNTDRESLSRSAVINKSYIDLTSESDEDEIRRIQVSQKEELIARSSKRKRVTETPSATLESEVEEDDIALGEEEYEIDHIVNSRIRSIRGTKYLEFLIHWKGYPSSDDSWTAANQFEEDDPPVLRFYAENPGKPKLNGLTPVKVKIETRSIVEVRSTHSPQSVTRSQRSSRSPRINGSGAHSGNGNASQESPLNKLHTKITNIRSFFFGGGSPTGKGKENYPPTSGSKPSASTTVASAKGRGTPTSSSAKRSTPIQTSKSTTAPVRKKRKVEDDDSDFEFKPEEEKEEEEDDDEEFKGTDEEGGAEGAESEDEGGDVDSESADDEVVTKKPAPYSKKPAGWGVKIKATKKAPVNLGAYKTGIKPLGQKTDIKNAIKNLSEDLPPLDDIELMFDHLVSRVPDVVKLVEHLNGRKLRVATMCSGTESPLLALNMIAKAIKSQHDLTLSFDHVFSCEIEPFKQAYIERNFSPPILFRDVTELGKKRAHTAYGSLAEVPGNVDILIAGTSCVDYSNLNNQQQEIEANGESGRTFRGMLQWVKKHQPPIVILENVCGAPWDKVVEYFSQIDYDAQYTRLDTKEYYIPHTRTRVYLFATPAGNGGKSQHLAEKWSATVKDLRRPWSSPFEAFLLDTDDPNIHRARLELAAAREMKDGTSRKATDWNRCESRHQRARQDEELGLARPLTSWQEAGVCKGLDWTWNDWLLSQTERVLDLLEISTLRMAKDGVDSGFKACIWNVSQNVDRQTGSGRTALAPCLTPNMIPWATNRGGPVTGREALALQGIPVRELLLTSENEDQLADLAGNAMTTTVVGSSMLAALKVALEKLVPGGDAKADAARIEEEVHVFDDLVAKRIIGEEALETHELDLAKVIPADIREILDMAERSSRHCQCEGQSGTSSPIEECSACGYRACKSCGGRPDHLYEACANVRVEPGDFEKRFKELLPMRVQIAGITEKILEKVRERAEKSGKGTVTPKDWSLWSKAVLQGLEDAEFRFRYLKRQYTWTAVYEAPNATLDLFLEKTTPEWRLTIKAPIDEPVNSRLRALLLHPVARLRFNTKGHDVLGGPWELCIPTNQTFKVDITGRGELVPSWHASLGLQGKYDGATRWSQLDFSFPPEAIAALDRDLSGTYTLLPKCGQAMNSLHKKDATPDSAGTQQLYLFFDPTRCGEAEDDFYVFSSSTERLTYGIERAVIATLDPRWRESSKPQEKVNLNIRGGWTVCDAAHMTAVGGRDIAVVEGKRGQSVHRDSATYAVPSSATSISVDLDHDGCTHASALLSCRVPLHPAHSESMWRDGAWGEVDLLHNGNKTFSNLAWITERLPFLDNMSRWTALAEVNESGSACDRCSPRPPKIHWIKKAGKKNKNGGKTKSTIVSYEDKLEAGRYEHALKNRPAPFVVQLRLDKDIGSFRIGLNIVSLAHRALSRLPVNASKGQVKLSWRLTPGQVADVPQPPRVFMLPSNKRDPQHDQPRGFKLPLRKEQLRSLWWMLEQERAEGKSYTFIEEEISEAALPSLGWRAEGKAERPVMIRGGVIADQVGYGKTIISLALIAESKNTPAPEPAPKGLIDLKATLIVVPGHLSKQWPNEITRFTGNTFKTIVIQNMRDLQGRSISQLAKADIIIVANEVFESDTYWDRFEYLSSQPEQWLKDAQGGRYFCDRLDTAMSSLRDQVGVLASEGAEAAYDTMKERQAKAKEEVESRKDAHKSAGFGKRMKGQAYRDKYDTIPEKKKGKVVTTEDVEKWEASEDEEDDDEDETEALPLPSFRKASGTESLTSSSVKTDYKTLSSPVMHMFRFRRVIADEFTYLDKKTLPAVLRLSSCYKWVLSGTPPVGSFPDIRSVATFMGIHLGVEDDAEGDAQSRKARAKELTAAEKFHAFRETHSQAWHKRRDDLAQEFLNAFVRQNIAEIDEIPTVEHIHHIKLPAAEGAVYLELEHHLQALEMQARKETKFKNVTQGDRNARLEEALADSRTAEEALLKRCCHFTLDLKDPKRDAQSAGEACDHITGARRSQLKGCEEDLYRSVNLCVGLHLWIKKKGFFGKSDEDRQHFAEWVDFSLDRSKHQGDSEAAAKLVTVLERCGFSADGAYPTVVADGSTAKIDKGDKVEDVKWRLREQSHLLRRLSKELVGRVRSFRFFEVVRKLQRNGKEAKQVLEGSACGHKPSNDPNVEMAVLSCCGHVACRACMLEAADNQRCVKGEKCHAAVRHTNIVKVSSLGIEGELSSGKYGAKLQRLVDLIHTIPKDQRILVFLQWEDLSGKVSEALREGKIPHITLTGAVKQRANTLEKFQSTDAESARVLLLKQGDPSAAGSNLTTANHAIFLGPLFTNSLYNYRAFETQAIGRIRRYGQERKVHVHRLLALDTIDVTMFEGRKAELRAKADYEELPVTEYKGKKIVPKKSKAVDVMEVD